MKKTIIMTTVVGLSTIATATIDKNSTTNNTITPRAEVAVQPTPIIIENSDGVESILTAQIESSKNTITELNQKITDLESVFKTSEDTRSKDKKANKTAIEALKSEIKGLQDNIEAKDKDIAEIKASAKNAESIAQEKIASHLKQKQVDQETIEQLEKGLADLEAVLIASEDMRLDDLETKNTAMLTLKSKIKGLRGDIEAKDKDIAEIKASAKKAESIAQEKIASHLKQKQVDQTTIEDLTKKVSDLETVFKTSEDMRNADLVSSKNAMDMLTGQIKGLHSDIEAKDKDIADIKSSAKNAESIYQAKIEDLETVFKTSEDMRNADLVSSQNAMDMLNGQIKGLHSDIEAKEKYIANIKSSAKNAESIAKAKIEEHQHKQKHDQEVISRANEKIKDLGVVLKASEDMRSADLVSSQDAMSISMSNIALLQKDISEKSTSIDLLSSEIDKVNTDLRDAKIVYKSTLEDATNQISGYKSEIQTMTKITLDIESQLAKDKTKISSLSKEISQSIELNANLLAEISHVSTSNKSLMEMLDVEYVSNLIISHRNQLNGKDADMVNLGNFLGNQLNEFKNRVKELEASADVNTQKHIKESKALKDAMAEVKARLQKSESISSKAELELKEAKSSLDDTRDDIYLLESISSKGNKLNLEKELALLNIQTKLDALTITNEKLKVIISKATDDNLVLVDAKKERDSYQTKNKALESQISDLKASKISEANLKKELIKDASTAQHNHKMASELIKANLKDKQNSLEELIKDKEDLVNKLKKSKEDLYSYSNQVGSLQELNKDVQSQKVDIEKAILDLRIKHDKKVADLVSRNQSLTNKAQSILVGYDTEVGKLEAASKTITDIISEKNDLIKAEKAVTLKLAEKTSAHKKQLELLNMKLTTAENEKFELNSTISTAEKDIQSLLEEKSSLTSDLEKYKAKSISTKNDLQTKGKSLESLISTKESLIKQLKTKISNLNLEHESMDKQNKAIEETLSKEIRKNKDLVKKSISSTQDMQRKIRMTSELSAKTEVQQSLISTNKKSIDLLSDNNNNLLAQIEILKVKLSDAKDRVRVIGDEHESRLKAISSQADSTKKIFAQATEESRQLIAEKANTIDILKKKIANSDTNIHSYNKVIMSADNEMVGLISDIFNGDTSYLPESVRQSLSSYQEFNANIPQVRIMGSGKENLYLTMEKSLNKLNEYKDKSILLNNENLLIRSEIFNKENEIHDLTDDYGHLDNQVKLLINENHDISKENKAKGKKIYKLSGEIRNTQRELRGRVAKYIYENQPTLAETIYRATLKQTKYNESEVISLDTYFAAKKMYSLGIVTQQDISNILDEKLVDFLVRDAISILNEKEQMKLLITEITKIQVGNDTKRTLLAIAYIKNLNYLSAIRELDRITKPTKEIEMMIEEATNMLEIFTEMSTHD